MERTRVLLVRGPDRIAGSVGQLLERDSGLDFASHGSCAEALQDLPTFRPHVVVFDCPGNTPPGGAQSFGELLQGIDAQGIACLLLKTPGFGLVDQIPEWVQTIAYENSAEDLTGRLACIRHYQRIVRRSQLELRHMRRLGQHLNKQFVALDQDMRLASRLQREFLPQDFPVVPGLRFSVLYRPASWVSGDIYDIAQVDEDHICAYVADAVGHGMAASLLTIYVKRAIHSKELSAQGYALLSPSQTLERLNHAIIHENLKNSQFITAGYCLLNWRDLTLHVARGGHPHPLLIDTDGTMREIQTEGGLLGLFPEQEFPTLKLTLKPGQKVILHSDGMEQAFLEDRDYRTGKPRYKKQFERVAHLPAEELTTELERMIDTEEGSLNPGDDVTIIVLEIAKTSDSGDARGARHAIVNRSG